MGFKFCQMGVLDGLPIRMYIEEDNITIGQMIEYISKEYSRDIYSELFKGDKLKPDLLLFVNGQNYTTSGVLNTVIQKDSDVLLIVQIFGG